MAIQFGTVDGLVNITNDTILCFVKGIDEFISQGGPAYARNLGISYGTAFQRFIEPVYVDRAKPYTLESIKQPVLTRSGSEQSPARGTFCKKMGLLKIDESNGIFEITPIGKAILNNEISIEEYSFILLSKMGVFKNGEYIDNLLDSISVYFQSNATVSQNFLEKYIKLTYGDNDIVKTRLDIIINSLVVTGLLAKVTNDIYVLSGTAAAVLFIDYDKHSNRLRTAIIDNSKEYSDYIGNLDNGGVLDILDNDNIGIYIKLFPNLFRFMKRDNGSNSLQQIFYGAPGTGKSKTIKNKTEEAEKEGRVFRTTFHPDSDYSTFVGCYKPGMKTADKLYSAEELAVKLKEIKNSGVTYPCHKFAAQYWRSLKDQPAEAIKQILLACGFTESMNVEISKGVAIGQEYLNKDEDGKIIYAFTPQAFTNAYVKAWNTEEDVYLIIEEINRGNCAQIFGDLFQLLDRKNGVSEYPIDADSDLAKYISKKLENSPRTDFPAGVKEGEKLVLPSNLYIWATMNTSDQSLFPIDSAFKRRWDWFYVPIDTRKENWYIKIGDSRYSWTAFLEKVNNELLTDETAEDKHLGFYFCKANDGIISKETFVSKVLFYLWTDVFKVYGIPSAIGSSKDWPFTKFYNTDGSINEEQVRKLMETLKIADTTSEAEGFIDTEKMEESVSSSDNKNHPKEIRFTDGTSIDVKVGVFDAYCKAIEKIGIDRVATVAEKLKYRRKARPLISKEKYPELDGVSYYSYHQIGDYYLVKGAKTYTYVRILEDLEEMLKVGMTVVCE